MNQQNSLLEAALGYARKGWCVFPCAPGQKKPLLSKKQGGNGCLDGTTDEAQITKWWTDCPTANIGLLCGKQSGVYVVDVDLDLEKGVNGWETLRTLLEEGKSLPPTLIQDSPRGGAHYIYKSDNPPANKNNFMGERFEKSGIDIRSDNYYIMLAPSLHPNGKKYAWRESSLLIDIAEFPDFMRPEKKEIKVSPPWEQKKLPVSKKKSGPDNMILERASAYLAECDPAIQGSGGHDALLWAARTMVIGFDLSDSAALSLLWSEYNPRCMPSWDQNNASDVKDFERKVKQARDTNKKPVGWLLDEYGLRTGSDEEQIINLGREIAKRLMGEPEDVPKQVYSADTDFDVEDIEKVEPKKPKKAVKSSPPPFLQVKKPVVTGVFSEEILNPPGFVGDLCRWINSTAGKHQPILTLGAAICAAGAIFGRKVKDRKNGRTNIYAMGIGHSSSGKDHAPDCIEQLLERAGATHLLGGSRVTSESAIEVGLENNPIQLFHWDEVGHFFTSIKQSGAGTGGASHMTTIIPCLMELYSSAHKIYKGKQKAEGTRRLIDQPHVCIWGMTSPKVLFNGLSSSQIDDGWLGRVITLISSDDPKYNNDSSWSPPPDDLVEYVRKWVVREVPVPDGEGDIRGAITTHQILVPETKLAYRVFDKFNDECHNNKTKCRNRDDNMEFIWGKAYQNARRIALIIAAGENYDNPEISEANALYACEFIRITINEFEKIIKGNMADNQWEAEKLRIIKVLENFGKEGCSKSDFCRKTYFLRDKRTRDNYIAELLESEMIDIGIGDHGKTYYWVHPLGVEYKIRKGASE